MRKRSLRQRLAGTVMVATLVAGGLGTTAGAAQAAPVSAVNSAVSAAPVTLAAGGWGLQGIFPDPVTCHIAGIASGREYVCVWYVLAWALNVWQD
ncbi:hypothetical protein ACGFIK_14705 [Micromonospora sp. NPDC048871]|uniref:hypothetical protein n=1 Tax=unclassified Micromonospora TaxID=2617518 RepID=UPI002E166B3A|nr:hypothetical protein OIE53_10965 [Micromonospora sp. NBC_01739]